MADGEKHASEDTPKELVGHSHIVRRVNMVRKWCPSCFGIKETTQVTDRKTICNSCGNQVEKNDYY